MFLVLVLLVSPIKARAATLADGSAFSADQATNLAWAPPSLVDPQTIDVPDSVQHLALSHSRDYVLKLPAGGRTGALWIDGGHNVVLIGGQITIPSSANQVDNGEDDTDTGIYIDGATGTVHIEGVLITGQPNVMFDGIDVNAPLATIQIENVRVDNVWGSDTTEHADVIQTWGGFKNLRIDHLTANGDYQGLTIDPDLGSEGTADIRNVDLTLDPPPAALASTTVGGGHMIWLSNQTKSCKSATSIRFSNVYVDTTNPRVPSMNTVWPEAHSSDLPCPGTLSGNSVTWPSLPVTGSVTLGSPLGGSFVPSGVAGLNYTSPGYGPTASTPPQPASPAQPKPASPTQPPSSVAPSKPSAGDPTPTPPTKSLITPKSLHHDVSKREKKTRKHKRAKRRRSKSHRSRNRKTSHHWR
jgi:hypothetical protein